MAFAWLLSTVEVPVNQYDDCLQKLKESDNEETAEASPRNEDDFAASFRLRSALQDAIMAEKYTFSKPLPDVYQGSQRVQRSITPP